MTAFFRVLGSEDQATHLHDMVESYRSGLPHQDVYETNPASFKLIPKCPFSYWVSENVINLFQALPRFESENRTAKIGLSTSDDFRFLRIWWEAPAVHILDAQKVPISVENVETFQNWCCERTQHKRWILFAKGGEYSPYYSDLHLIINWKNNGEEIKTWVVNNPSDPRTAHWSRRIANWEFYFRPGLTWPLRTNGLSFRILPSGSIFGHKGPAAFVSTDSKVDLLKIIAVLNSCAFDFLVQMLVARVSLAQSFEVGLIQSIPIPSFQISEETVFKDVVLFSVNLKRSLDTANELSHIFHLPALLQTYGVRLSACLSIWNEKVIETQKQVGQNQQRIDDEVFRLYGIEGKDRQTIEAQAASPKTPNSDEDEEELVVDANRLVLNVLAYMLGCTFGRWDIRYATGDKQPPELPDPFAPLPVCPPGMLQNADGLPAEPQDVSEDYPLRITWNGILVDDEGHPEDIVARVREALEVIWQAKAGDIEQEACEILGVKTLRDYLGNPNKFFIDHLKRYSKSRRQAPIYWPLSTASGSYTLWLYYHRLTDQTLYTCVNDYVEPKLKHVANTLADLRRKPDRSRQEEKTLEQLTDLEHELQDFRDELLRIAAFWKPNLNDGVQITAAPLWKLFKLSKWQKTLKQTWGKLEKGDYDWAHLAYSIWPERVIRASRKDRSYAIAHNLEETLWEEVDTTDKRGKAKTEWRSRTLSDEELQQIIQCKTS